MAQTNQTPGVYIVEQNAFPNSVVEVATAIPAFIGCTQHADFNGRPLARIPTKVASLKEFESFFGIGFIQPFALTLAAGATTSGRAAGVGADAISPSPAPAVIAGALPPVALTFPAGQTATLLPQGPLFYLYNAIRMFYLNGGATCYIVSIGDYTSIPRPRDFTDAIDLLEAEQDPTMILCPDALMMARADYAQVMTYMLGHCQKMQSRVALFDVYGDGGTGTGTTASSPPIAADTERFRDDVGNNYLNYGIAYYPWVNASVVAATDVSFLNLTAASLTALAGLATTPGLIKAQFAAASTVLTAATTANPPTLDDSNLALHHSLLAGSPEYGMTLRVITNYLNVLPVAPAMAGIFTAVDSTRGVWKAPANVSLNAVVAPNVLVSDQDQGMLNVDAVTGKSINVIRAFKGLGTLVWGARTLDGNSQDWRYINVRRTMIMIEQSLKLAARSYVFEPNDANTWGTVKSMMESFLFSLWKQGALAGAAPADAYSVQVGLGSTMTADDILNGLMNVTVLVALARPAEFIVVTFKQQMQVS